MNARLPKRKRVLGQINHLHVVNQVELVWLKKLVEEVLKYLPIKK